MQNFLSSVWFALNVTFPSLMLLALGWFARRIHLVNEQFITQASKVVFYFGLPCLISVICLNNPYI